MFVRKLILVLILALMATVATAGEIHQAIAEGDLSRVQALVRSDAEVIMQQHDNRDLSLPLHIAAVAGQLEIIEYLIANGAVVDGHDKDESTPLMVACLRGQVEAAKLLLEHGAAADQADLNGSTPAKFAMNSANMEIVRLLQEAGVDFSKDSSNNSTYMYSAALRGNVELMEFLFSLGEPVTNTNSTGSTPLLGAAITGETEALLWLLAKGAAPNQANERGDSPLIKSAERGSLENVEALLEAGAKVSLVESRQGRQALHMATAKGFGDIAVALIKAGAPLNTVDNAGATPAMLASNHGNLKISKVLTKAGATPCNTSNVCELASTTKKYEGNRSGVLKSAKAPAKGDARVWYLGHSSMAVQTQNNLLIFDYFENGRKADSPCMSNGNICAEEIADLKVTVFATHIHGDHYDPVIFDWRDQVKDITYVLGFDPNDENVPAHKSIGPRETKKFGDMAVHTIKSNDGGVGFMVEVDGLSIFHAGDHANRQLDLSGDYCPEIDYLVEAGYYPDLTMLPTTGCGFGDPAAVRAGIDYTLSKFGPTTFFPMHAGSNPVRYVEIWDEISPKHTQVEAVIPRDNGNLYFYSATNEHVMN